MGSGAIVPYTRDTASHVDMLRELDPKRAIAAEDALLSDLGAVAMPSLGGGSVESPLDDKKAVGAVRRWWEMLPKRKTTRKPPMKKDCVTNA